MRITEVIAEATDHTGVNKVAENPTEDPNGRGQQNNYRGQYQSNCRQFNTSLRGYYNKNYYSNYQGRGGCGCGGNNFRGCSCGQGSYRGHNNYQYHQYYTHDDGSQVEQQAHHAHFAVVLTILLSTVFKENMT